MKLFTQIPSLPIPLVIHKSVWKRCAQRKIKQMKMACGYGLFKTSSKENLTDAEVPGYRFQPQIQRHALEDRPEANDHDKKDTREAEHTKDKLAEMLSTDGGAESICWSVTGVCLLS